MSLKRYMALTRGGIISELQYRLGTFVTIFGNLIYLTLVYYGRQSLLRRQQNR